MRAAYTAEIAAQWPDKQSRASCTAVAASALTEHLQLSSAQLLLCRCHPLDRYADWTTQQVKAAGTASVAVLYASAYGNTASLAQAISRGITKAGGALATHTCMHTRRLHTAGAARSAERACMGCLPALRLPPQFIFRM